MVDRRHDAREHLELLAQGEGYTIDRFHRAGTMPPGVQASDALSHRWILSNGYVPHAFEVLDKAVAKTGHLVGDQFTFADINLLPILHRVRQAPEGARAVAKATNLARYYDRHAERPSFKKTDPPAGPPRRAKPG